MDGKIMKWTEEKTIWRHHVTATVIDRPTGRCILYHMVINSAVMSEFIFS